MISFYIPIEIPIFPIGFYQSLNAVLVKGYYFLIRMIDERVHCLGSASRLGSAHN
jgi:hypothetical protein